jgi:hypothetical protein
VLPKGEAKVTKADFLLYAAAVLTLGAIGLVAFLYLRDLRQGEAAKNAVDNALNQLSQDVSFANYLQYSHSELHQYHVQSRARARWSFIASLTAMFIGLGLLGIGVYYATHSSDVVGRALVAALTAIGGTLSGYIGRTFMETQRQIEDEVRFLVAHSITDSLFLMAERLAQELKDTAREETIGRIINEVLAAAGNGGHRTANRLRRTSSHSKPSQRDGNSS